MNKWLPLIARVLLGFIFFGAGLSGLLNLAPPPADLPEDMKTYMAGIMAAKYFMPLLKVTETVCGALLMSGFFVPLALVILAPIIINIFFTHLFLAPEGMVVAIVLAILEIYLAFFSPYSPKIKALFRAK
jgi:putative oxidoreductase